jgi:hypothetical protein
MRRLVVVTVLAGALAVPAAGFAFNLMRGVDDGTLSVKNGTGKIGLTFNGSVVGRIGHGRITLTDPNPSDGDGILTWGRCDFLNEATTTCSGSNIRFRAIGGKYQIAIRGAGIYLSAVGHGTVTLDGRGDSPDVNYDGVYSFNDLAYKSLPDNEKTFSLAAPAGG